jgi:hypothetical protein
MDAFGALENEILNTFLRKKNLEAKRNKAWKMNCKISIKLIRVSRGLFSIEQPFSKEQSRTKSQDIKPESKILGGETDSSF